MTRTSWIGVCVCVLAAANITWAQEATTKPAQPQPPAAAAPPVTAATAKSPLDFTMQDIDGRDVPLHRYDGDVVLIVNVASKCGLTPQYKELQAVFEKYRARGFRVAAFPANNFRAQEPGSNAEIKQFCASKYDVTFDLFSKVSVKGDDQCELYKWLTSKDTNPQFAGEIEWNFAKFLVDRNGRVVARFHPRVKPDDKEVLAAIEKALGEKSAAPAEKPKP